MLKGVSLQCAQGEICAVLGANGAGKSTLFKIITGLMAPSSGSVQIHAASTKPIGGIIEKPALYPYLNARENLKVFGGLQGLSLSQTEIDEKLQEVGLSVDNPIQVRNFSMGMKQRLGIAIALLNQPQALVWDEPFSGLDPMGMEALKKLILQLAKQKGLAIILSSHIMEPLLSLCDSLYVLKNGALLLSGTLDEIITKYGTRYEIRGNGLHQSRTLQKYGALLEGNRAVLEIPKELVHEVLYELLKEDLEINSFGPKINFEEIL